MDHDRAIDTWNTCCEEGAFRILCRCCGIPTILPFEAPDIQGTDKAKRKKSARFLRRWANAIEGKSADAPQIPEGMELLPKYADGVQRYSVGTDHEDQRSVMSRAVNTALCSGRVPGGEHSGEGGRALAMICKEWLDREDFVA